MTDATTTGRIGVYPGTFDPPTIAHLEIARVAVEQLGLERLDLTISTATLGKDDTRLTPIDERIDALTAITGDDPRLRACASADSLIADIAEDYDVIVVGGDKWAQVLDPVWYGSVEARDDALRRLPLVALAPRPPWTDPRSDPVADAPDLVTVVVLAVDPGHHGISASAVRAGRDDWRARPPSPRTSTD